MKDSFTIPNIISLIRICMIPIFIYLYFSVTYAYHYQYALLVILLSAISDIIDGFIARKFNMVSDVGKVLDPIADKLTQVSVVFCLLFTHKELIVLVIVLFTKELLTLFVAIYVLKSGFKPFSSKWFGKLATVMVYLTFFYAVFMDIYTVLPTFVLQIMSLVTSMCLFISMVGYMSVLIKSDFSEK